MLHFDLNLHMIDTAPKVLMTLDGALVVLLGWSAMYLCWIYAAAACLLAGMVHITSLTPARLQSQFMQFQRSFGRTGEWELGWWHTFLCCWRHSSFHFFDCSWVSAGMPVALDVGLAHIQLFFWNSSCGKWSDIMTTCFIIMLLLLPSFVVELLNYEVCQARNRSW